MRFISFLLMLSGIAASAQNRSIQFEQGAWKDILSKAKSEKKIIMLDAYASWCGPCKWMAKNVFTNDTVADFYNNGFVNAKFDMEKGEGIELAKKYGVMAYPTFLFINGDGQVVHRICGSEKPGDFIKTGQKVLIPEKTLRFAEERFKSDTKNAEYALSYFKMLSEGCANVNDAANMYLDGLDPKTLSESGNWKIMYQYVSSNNSKAFKYMVKNQEEFGKKYTADSVSNKILSVYEQSFRKTIADNDRKAFDELKKEVTSGVAADANKLIWRAEMSFAKKDGNWVNYANVASQYIDAYGMSNPSLLNEVAWNFYEHVEDKALLAKAAAWAKKSIELDDKYYNNDTYAALLFKLGNKEEAKIVALKAIELGKSSGQDVKDTEELLKKIETLK